jgi:hypothetical protein
MCLNTYMQTHVRSRDSSVGTATSYGLDDRKIGDRFPVGAGNFSLRHHVQTRSGAHPASYPLGTGGSLAGGKAAGARSWPLTSTHCRAQRMRGPLPPLPQYVFIVKHRDSFTFTRRITLCSISYLGPTNAKIKEYVELYLHSPIRLHS